MKRRREPGQKLLKYLVGSRVTSEDDHEDHQVIPPRQRTFKIRNRDKENEELMKIVIKKVSSRPEQDKKRGGLQQLDKDGRGERALSNTEQESDF